MPTDPTKIDLDAIQALIASGEMRLLVADTYAHPLHSCKPGPFLHGSMLGFLSEYGDNNGRRDAYCDTGEFFWAGTTSPRDQGNIDVRAMWEEPDTLAALLAECRVLRERVLYLEAPGECQSLHKLRARIIDLERVADTARAFHRTLGGPPGTEATATVEEAAVLWDALDATLASLDQEPK